MKGVTFHIPLSQATNPTSGACIANAWWSVHPQKGAAFYAQLLGYAASEEPSPQCNTSEATSRVLSEKLYPDHEVVHLPVVFLAHAQREMLRLRSVARAAREGGSRLSARADQNQPPSPSVSGEPSR